MRAIVIAGAATVALALAAPAAQAATVACTVATVNEDAIRPYVSNLRATNTSCRAAQAGANEVQYGGAEDRTVLVNGRVWRVSYRVAKTNDGSVLKYTLRRGAKRITFDGV